MTMAEQGSAAEDERERLRIELRDVRLKRTAGEFWQAVDRLIDFEIRHAVDVGRAEMPCCDAWAEVYRRGGLAVEYDLLAFCPTGCVCPCPSCTARQKLEVSG